MTKREKKARADARAMLKEQGVLPPDKKPLNRKKFIEEAVKEWEGRDGGALLWDRYLMKAFAEMMAHRDRKMRVSLEAVGAAKVLRLAVRIQKFEKQVQERGETTYNVKDLYEYVKDIMDA